MTGFGLQYNFVSATESEAAKAIPLGLVVPNRALWKLFHRLRLGGGIRRSDWKGEPGKGVFQRFGGEGGGGDASPLVFHFERRTHLPVRNPRGKKGGPFFGKGQSQGGPRRGAIEGPPQSEQLRDIVFLHS